MTFHRIAQLNELYDGFRRVVRIGRDELLLLQHDGELHLLDNRCPHQGFPLDRGSLQGRRLVCPRHGFAFHLQSGECVQARSCTLPVHVVAYDGNWVGVDLL